MKAEIVKSRKPKLILQVFHNYFQYQKDLRSFDDRKELTVWRKEIHSKSGYGSNGKLILGKSDYSPDLLNCDLIILNDFNTGSETEAIIRQDQRWQKDIVTYKKGTESKGHALNYIQFLNITGTKKKYEIFQVMGIDDQIELHLLYDMYEIGQPYRENFKLCNLEMNVPVEIKINGKLDHSLTSGRERTFKEHCYIFNLIAQTNKFELAREPFSGSIKQIPKPLKIVDLMKELY